jgi:hypothetical protein
MEQKLGLVAVSITSCYMQVDCITNKASVAMRIQRKGRAIGGEVNQGKFPG